MSNNTHAVDNNQGRNVHCVCGAEYSLMTNLMAHITRATGVNEYGIPSRLTHNGYCVCDSCISPVETPAYYSPATALEYDVARGGTLWPAYDNAHTY